jgi:hypothetical protein
MIFTRDATTVTLPANLFNNPMPLLEHLSTRSTAQDGTDYVYNQAVNFWYYKIKIRINEAQRAALRAFVKNTLQFDTLTFSFTADAPIDIGRGVGAYVTVRWWEESYHELPVAPGRWELSFTLRSSSIGTGSPPGAPS